MRGFFLFTGAPDPSKEDHVKKAIDNCEAHKEI